MEDIDDNDQGPRRPKRQLSNKQKKLELLEKMRSVVKGGKKNKYEIGQLENVYEEIDEREYSKKVLQRQEDDWIVDDDGSGYIEDGRDIFDDDLDEESVKKSKSEGGHSKKRSRTSFEAPSSEGSRKGNIRNMLVSMPAKKKKESNVKLEEDDILGDIIGELDGISSPKAPSIKKKLMVDNEVSARDYMKSLAAKKIKKPEVVQVLKETQNNKSDHELTPSSPLKKEEKDSCGREGFLIPVESVQNTNKKSYVKVEPMETDMKESDLSHDIFEGLDEDELGEFLDETSKNGFNSQNTEVIEKKEIKSENCKLNVFTKSVPNDVKIKEDKEEISEQWGGNQVEEEATFNVQIDKNQFPLTKNKNGDEVFRFYYWDAHEEPFSQPGTIYLFGKVFVESVKTYVSCCVAVKNIERRIFLLPRENKMNLKTGEETSNPVSMSDVYDEFNTSISSKYKIKSFRSRKITKKYCFAKAGVPAESEYLEVRYAANFPALPSDFKGETFSCVFGTNTSFMELLILDRGLKGPGWIELKNVEPNQVPISWCKVEATCSKPNFLTRLRSADYPEIPPLIIVTLVPFIVYNPKSKQSEVTAAICLVNNAYHVDKPSPPKLFGQHFCVLSKPSDLPWPYDLRETLQKFSKTKIEKMETERALLNFLLTKLYRIDPDLIVGHDLSGFGIDVLVERLGFHKVPNWSRLGRLRRANIPHGKAKFQLERIALTGRLMCDIKTSAKELIKSRSYDLEMLCQNVLRFPEGKREEMNEDIFRYSYSSGTSLLESVWIVMKDASYILKIFAELNVLPLALQITNIAGNVMSRTLMGGRSERNEFLLLHAFHSKDYIVPDKEYKKSKKQSEEDGDEGGVKNARKKPTYAGGLVLDPKVGLYDDLILLMDFNSLYPSIIQEYNVCFTTIPISSVQVDDDFFDNLDSLLPDDTVAPGVLPTEIRKLVESRREVKSLLKNQNLSPELKMQYDIRQMALKLTANSMYGCLGFAQSRFFAKPLAALVTAKGREILMNTKKMVESYGYEVVYGDTDSLMINTRTKELDQVNQIGRKIKVEVNKCYKQVELDIDGIFKTMLLLRKKKYAAVTISKLSNGEIVEKKEMKGLDMVRRDWSQLSAEVGKMVLDQILADQTPEDRIENIHSYLETVRQELEDGKVPLSLLTVTKQLTKPPEEYADPKGLPHVLVALRLNKTSAKRFKQGDTVSYVICEDGTNNSATQRAYHIEELKNPEKNLKIDTNYYLSQQIHPVIGRLCDPIEGTDAASLALCLGLDASLYKQKSRLDNDDENPDDLFGKRDEERFKDCEKFSFICKNCEVENIIDGPKRKNEKGQDVLVLECCVNEKCDTSPISYFPYIQNCLQLSMRKHIKLYAERWLVCIDPLCGHRGRVTSSYFDGAYPMCIKCKTSPMKREYSSLQLYNQLAFYGHMFDVSKINRKHRPVNPTIAPYYSSLQEQVNEVLKYNKYSVVNLSSIFMNLFPVHKKIA